MKHLYGPLSSQVAESIGITEEFLRKKEVHADCIPCKCTSPEEAPEELEGAGPQKRANEVGMARGAPGRRPASGELLRWTAGTHSTSPGRRGAGWPVSS